MADYTNFRADDSPITDEVLDAVRSVESGGNTQAVSPKGAQGPYQFMPATAKEYGIDPFDEEQSREAARQFLQKQYDKHGSLDHALAAYNGGPGRLQKVGLANMPQETKDYVKKVNGKLAPAAYTSFVPDVSQTEASASDYTNFVPDDTPSGVMEPALTSASTTPSEYTDFQPSTSTEPPGTVDPAHLPVGGIGEQVGGAVSALSDILAPVGTVIGGVAAGGDLINATIKNAFEGKLGPQQADWDLANYHMNKWQEWTLTGLAKKAGIEDRYLDQNATYQDVMSPLHALQAAAEPAGGWVTDKTGSPTLGTIVNVAVQTVPAVLLHGTVKGAAGIKALSPEMRQMTIDAQRRTLVDNVNDAFGKLEGAAGFRPPVEIPPDMTSRQYFDHLKSNNGNHVDILNLIAQHPEMEGSDAATAAMARIYANVGATLGLDKVEVRSEPKLLDDLNWNAAYSQTTDHIKTHPTRTDPQTYVHEANHPITAGAAEFLQDVRNGKLLADDGSKLTRDTLDPQRRDMYDRLEAIDKVFELATDKITTKYGVHRDLYRDAWTMPGDVFREKYKTGLPEEVKRTRDDHYGLSNLKEFMAELGSNQKFRQILQDIPLEAHEVVKVPGSKAKFHNLWDYAKDSIKKLFLGGSGGNTLHSIAFDHMMGIVDHMTPEMRSYKFNDATKARTVETRQRINDLIKVQDQISNQATRVYLYKIANLLKEAKNPDEFLTRARTFNGSPEWQQFITDKGEHMMNMYPQIVKAFGHDTLVGKLSAGERLLTSSYLSVDDFIKDFKKFAKAAHEERGLKFDENSPHLFEFDDLNESGTRILPDTQIKMTKGQGEGGKKQHLLGGLVSKFFIEKAREYSSIKSQMFYKSINMIRRYSELKAGDKKAMMQMAIHWDSIKGRKTLVEQGLQWPTEEMIKDRSPNVKPEVVQAYVDVTKAMDFNYKLLNQALAKEGKPPLERIPGMMPHFFEGAYRVLVNKIETTAEGPKTQLVYVKGFQMRRSANKFADSLNAGKLDKDGVQYRPERDENTGESFHLRVVEERTDSVVQSLAEHTQAYKNMQGLDSRLLAQLERIEADALRGTTKHILERDGIGGFRGDLVNDMGFNEGLMSHLGVDAYNNRILKNYETYFKNVSEFYGNTMFMNEVATKLFDHATKGKAMYGDLIDQMPNLKAYVKEYTANFTGENYNRFANLIDSPFLRKPLKAAGLDPELAHRFANQARNFLSLSKLRGNIGFYIGNFIQPLHALSMLTLANEMLRQSGHKINYTAPVQAFIRAMTNRGDPHLREALQWAKDEHIIDDAMLEYQMRAKAPSTVMNGVHTATFGKVNPVIEMGARSFTFAIGHEFFKEVYKGNPELTRRAAQNLMEMVNVNYDRSTRPLMYQSFGIAGDMVSPFNVYRNAYLGNNFLMMKAVKSGNFHPAAFLPILAFEMIYLITAGTSGLFLANEWSQVADMWNHYNPESPVPSSMEFMLKMQHKLGAPDALTFGGITEATTLIPGLEHGVNLGSSLTASGLAPTLTSALFPFIDAIGSLVGIAGKAAGHSLAPEVFDPMSFGRAWKDLEAVTPQPFKGPLEAYGTTNKGVGFKSTNPTGYVSRDDSDWNSMMWTGRLSKDEYKARTVEREVTEQEKFRTQTLKNLVMVATDSIDGKVSQMTLDQAQLQAYNELQIPPAKFKKMVLDEYMKRNTTVRQREAMQRKMTPTEAATIQLRGALGQ